MGVFLQFPKAKAMWIHVLVKEINHKEYFSEDSMTTLSLTLFTDQSSKSFF